MTTYSNPRLRAVIENWPTFGGHCCTATFLIERNPEGERAIRTTIGTPKKLPYARKARIVDGDDGRIYIAHLTATGYVSIKRSGIWITHDTIFRDDPRYAEAVALFAETKLSPAPDAVMSAMETETDPLSDAVASAWDTELNPPPTED